MIHVNIHFSQIVQVWEKLQMTLLKQ